MKIYPQQTNLIWAEIGQNWPKSAIARADMLEGTVGDVESSVKNHFAIVNANS